VPTASDRTAAEAVKITRWLSTAVDPLAFGPPVTHVYNPLAYASAAVEQYLGRFCRPGVEAILVGMNPGPWGMAQTGVPFGEVGLVRDWLGISAEIGSPSDPHPKRPIQGLACERSEVSGARLWGWARDRFGTADAFFDRFFVWNFCPLVFMEESGRNRTPDKLPAEERAPLFEACDAALGRFFELLDPPLVVGVGKFAEKRCAVVAGDSRRVATVLHPSPASPIANRGWAPQAEAQLTALGIELPT
jgi:single-strand selective monofunctional uracil DNA glycosylase